MIHSAACTYAIRALARLASVPEGQAMKLRDIARVEAIPGPFLSGILPRLVEAGLLESLRGPTGGYRLARPAASITLHDLVEVVDGLQALEACAAGFGRCSDAVPCPLHDHWKPIRERVRGYLLRTTLADMAQALAVKRAALRNDLQGQGGEIGPQGDPSEFEGQPGEGR